MANDPETLLGFILLIAAGFLVAVLFYESLCQRDVLVARAVRITRRLTKRRWAPAVAYVLCVVVGLPLLVVVWALVLEAAFIVVGSVDRLGTAGLIAAAIVGAARLLAYIYAPSSHELAKAVPLSLAVVLITGGQLNIDAKLEAMLAGGSGFGDMTDPMLVVLVGLEWTLRILSDGSNALLAYVRSRRGTESEAGVWGTLRAIVRRPVRNAIAGAEAGAGAEADVAAERPGPGSPA